jgi:hypothetical protein
MVLQQWENSIISNVGKKRCTLQLKEAGKDFDVS